MDKRKLILFSGRKKIDSDYKLYLDKLDSLGYTIPGSIVQKSQNQLIIDFKDSGVWSIADRIPLFATDGDRNTAMVDLKALDKLALITEPVTFTSKIGINGDGVTGIVKSDFIADTDNINFQLNDFTVLMYSPNGNINAKYGFGFLGASPFDGMYGGKGIGSRVNSVDQISPLMDNDFLGLRRTSSENVSSINGSAITDYTLTSTLIALNRKIAWGGRDGSTSAYSNSQIAFGYIGGSLTNEQIELVRIAALTYIAAI